jgi:hypothetical protein
MLFVLLASIGFLVGLYMNYYDYTHDGVLNKPFQTTDPYLSHSDAGIDDSPLLNPIGAEERERERQVSASEEERERRRSSHGGSFSQGRGRTASRGGSFSAYEEINRGGAYRY